MHVVVLGAGVIGIATASCPLRDGHRLTLVERNEGVSLEAGHADGRQRPGGPIAQLARPGDFAAGWRPALPPDGFRFDTSR
jgi:D-amino-acid dehydrogenase